MFRNYMREPFSGLSHLLGAVLTIPALIFMLVKLPDDIPYRYLVSYLVFSVSMFLMFFASAIYHLMDVGEQTLRKLKRIDHIAIFIMIAGSYTPYCLIGLENSLALIMLSLIWSIAIMGIVIKMFWLHAPRWMSTVLYVAMGWMAIVVYEPLSIGLPSKAISWLLAGGIAYTLGAVVYATKWPNIHAKYFNFHDFWHIFVLAGATCHFISIGVYL